MSSTPRTNPRKPSTANTKGSKRTTNTTRTIAAPRKAHKYHSPQRTQDLILHDQLLRQIVDPKRFSTVYEVDQEQLRQLSADQVKNLIRGLHVRCRAAARVSVTHEQTPGPGEYTVPPIRTSVGPRWHTDTKDSSREQQETTPSNNNDDGTIVASSTSGVNKHSAVLASLWPGPGQYTVKDTFVSTKPSTPRITMHAKLNDGIGKQSYLRRNQVPPPGSYSVHNNDIGRNSPRFSMRSRVAVVNGREDPTTTVHWRAPGPGAYTLRSSLDMAASNGADLPPIGGHGGSSPRSSSRRRDDES